MCGAATENFRRYVIARPPWVIFAISLAIMATGILILACQLHVDEDDETLAKSVAQFCVFVDDVKRTSPSEHNFPSIFNNESTGKRVVAPLFLTMNTTVYKSIFNLSGNPNRIVRLSGVLHSGQIGFEEDRVNATFPFVINVHSWTPRVCADEFCDVTLLRICSIYGLNGDRGYMSGVSVKNDEKPCYFANVKDDISRSNGVSMNVINRLEANGKYETDPVYAWCHNGSIITLRREDAQQVDSFLLLHDTMAARMHLLYTTYFIFTVIILLIIYAMRRKLNHKHANGCRATEKDTRTFTDAERAK